MFICRTLRSNNERRTVQINAFVCTWCMRMRINFDVWTLSSGTHVEKQQVCASLSSLKQWLIHSNNNNTPTKICTWTARDTYSVDAHHIHVFHFWKYTSEANNRTKPSNALTLLDRKCVSYIVIDIVHVERSNKFADSFLWLWNLSTKRNPFAILFTNR